MTKKEHLKRLLARRAGKIVKVGYLPFSTALTDEQVESMNVVSLEKDGETYKGLGTLPVNNGVQLLFEFVLYPEAEEVGHDT